MKGSRKPYDSDLASWAERASLEIRQWLRAHGYDYTPYPHGKKGIDGKAESDSECFLVEVERRSYKTWNTGPFPFPTIHILERRGRYSDEMIHFTVRRDVRAAILTFRQSLLSERLVSNVNRFMPDGTEYVFDVPVRETLPIDLTEREGPSIAELNRTRLLGIAKGRLPPQIKLDALGSMAPYGICEEEWRELKDIAEQPLEECAFPELHLDVASNRNTIKPGTSGKPAMFCSSCDKFIGYIRHK